MCLNVWQQFLKQSLVAPCIVQAHILLPKWALTVRGHFAFIMLIFTAAVALKVRENSKKSFVAKD